MTNKEITNITLESLRDWFKKEKWVRISSSGNIAGPCGTSKNKKNPDRCLPSAKARSLTKAQRAATARKKKRAGAKGKTVVKNTKAATVKKENLDKVSGGIPYKIVNNQAIISMSLPDDVKQRIMRRAVANGYGAAPNMSGGITIFKETANPQDGKAAPFGSGYKPTKKMKEEKTINKSQIEKLKDMIKSLRKSSKGHAGQADYLGKLVKEAMTKDRLLAMMKGKDDIMVRLYDGTYYIVYSPYSDNDDNASMWGDDSVIGLNRDGDEREFRYDDIDDVDVYEGKEKTEIKRPSKQGIKRKLRKAFLEELVWEVLTEKDDRCTRIAKRKFDTWPSAYASGAVVRCRKGKIWKKEK